MVPLSFTPERIMNTQIASPVRVVALVFPVVLALVCGESGGPTPPPAAPLPTISSFTATPARITSDQGTTLAWTVTGAQTISIDQGVGVVTGSSRSVNPGSTKTYTLTATNSAGGTATATASVTVTAGV